MLSKAVRQYTYSGPPSKAHQPLQSRPPAVNNAKPAEPTKRKFERTMSSTRSLGALHDSTYFFDENDFDDDVAIDLTSTTPPGSKSVSYPALANVRHEVAYPSLPSVAPSHPSQHPQSSAPEPWSSSPPHHFQPPPSKRRTVPWLDKDGSEKPPAYTPTAVGKSTKSPYPWNKTASAIKDEQKELRKRNRLRTKPTKAQETADLVKKSSKIQVPATFLSDEQRGILKAVVDDGKSVFFTGSAGTGKSVLMRQIIAKLRDKHKREPDRVAVTASTGLAACNIEGITLHSYAGIGLGKDPAPELIKKIKRNVKIKTRWQRAKVLIIDEISMVDGDLFDKLEQVARSIRNNGRPFGGIQLIITGDFFQLPPVPEKDRVAKFAFDAATWNTSIEHTILLTHVFRQKDPIFAGMLNEMRLGKLSPASIKAFQRLSRPLDFEDELEATELFPTRNEVDYSNNSRMNHLSGQLEEFHAMDSGITDLQAREKILANFMAPKVVSLKKGAQVMLIKNIDTQLVNGSLGKIIAFMDENCFSFYSQDEETFMEAQKEGGSDDEKTLKAKQKLHAALYKDGLPTTSRKWPLVRFTLADNTSRTLLCVAEEWKTESPSGEIVAKRTQVPLILAWALSIHKAQGQTLERVKVDLGKVFEKGQAYVALSRATSQAGLQVTRFDARKVMVHPRVTEFYNNLVSIGSVLERAASKGEVPKGAAAQDYEQEFVDPIDFEDDEDDQEQLKQMYG